MAAKKKTSSRKPRTTRKNPVQANAKAAAEALGNARTIIQVHGIGNKPPPAVLNCQWAAPDISRSSPVCQDVPSESPERVIFN
jgi:hypothetical protein